MGYVVRGRVQGVGFRWWTSKLAARLGVVGTARNLRDGSVEVIVRASETVLARFVEELRRGPPMARVDSIDESAARLPDDVDDFRILH